MRQGVCLVGVYYSYYIVVRTISTLGEGLQYLPIFFLRTSGMNHEMSLAEHLNNLIIKLD